MSVDERMMPPDPNMVLERVTVSNHPCRYCGSKIRAEHQCRNCGAPDEHAHGPLAMAPMNIIFA